MAEEPPNPLDPFATVDPLETYDPDLTGTIVQDDRSKIPDSRRATKRTNTKNRPDPKASDQNATGPNATGPRRQSGVPTVAASNSERTGIVRSSRIHDPNTRYRPLKFHARGGLGAVFRAEDKELRRVVALKEILPQHAENPRYQEKFVFEAEVTGSLEHPGIVPVYGLGRYVDNQPYYAMRFIRGTSFRKSIEAFHQRNPLPTAAVYFTREFRALLRRLIETCNAIHYAHRHGVIHRDLKPDNIMLGDYGETLVVDWGLAKVIARNEADTDSDLPTLPMPLSGSGTQTRYGSAVGTPMYMSPEQAAGKQDELDGRTDIYSLGAMLFNLVSGNHPIEGTSASEIVSRASAGEIRNLSTVCPSAPRALASICERAMALSPNQRYQTATELADDIDRWLSDEVVQAHIGKERLIERLGRLIRRYRSWTISSAIALVAITLIATIAAFLIHGAKEKEYLAKLEANEFKHEALARYRHSREAIDTWLVQSSDAMEYFPETQAVRNRLLQLAVEDYEELATRYSSDLELELERGRAVLRLGDLAQMQNEIPKALQHYRRAFELFAKKSDDPVLSQRILAEQGNAMSRIGITLAAQEEVAEAARMFAISVELLQTASRYDEDPQVRRYLAAAYVNQGELRMREQLFEEAERFLELAMEQYALLDTVTDERAALGLARTRELLGRMHTQLGAHDKASQDFDQAIEVLLPGVTAQPDHPEFLDALASASISQANGFRIRGMDRNQLAALQSAVGHYRALVKALPGVPRYEENLAITQIDLGLTLHESGDNAAAESTLLEAQTILSRLATSYGSVPRFRDQLAACWDALGQTYLHSSDDLATANQLLSDSVTMYQTLAGEAGDRPDYVERLAIAQSHLAQVLSRQGQTESAKTWFEGAISVLEQLIEIEGDLPKYSSELAHVHCRYAQMLISLGEATDGLHFQKARDRWMQPGAQITASDADRLAWLLSTCPVDTVRDLQSASTWAEKAVELAPDNANFRTTQALVSQQTGQIESAIEQLEKVQSLRGEPIDRDHFVRALILQSQDQHDEAASEITRGSAWMESHRPFDLDLQRLRDLVSSSDPNQSRN